MDDINFPIIDPENPELPDIDLQIANQSSELKLKEEEAGLLSINVFFLLFCR